MTEIVIKKTKFLDLDLSFKRHPISSDVSRKVDLNAIMQSLKTLILTKRYERPFHPELSSQVPELLFENFTPDTGIVLERTIRYVVENFEPRVILNSVKVTQEPDDHNLLVALSFQIVGFAEVINIEFYLERTL